MELTKEQHDAVILIIDKARIRLMQSELSFFGHILLQLKQDYNGHEKGIPTVGVSIDTIFYNLYYLHETIKCTDDMVFIFMHEIMHLVLEHLDINRINGRDMKLWNYAGDYVINLDLFNSGFTYSSKDNILLDYSFSGKTTEEVYDILMSDPEKANDEKGVWSDIIPGDETENDTTDDSQGDGAEFVSAAKSLKDIITAAYNSHILANDDDTLIPKMVRDKIEEIKNPILPWRQLLQKYIGEVTQKDFSWNKLLLPFLPEFYIPSLHDESISKIDFAIDVSGSIDKKTFNTFMNEIQHILLMNNITKIGIYQFNTTTVSYDEVSNINELEDIKFNGGGGTNIRHTLNEANKSDAVALFIITDGYMDLNLTAINKPTIWCVYNNKGFKCPFGDYILFDKYIK